MVEWAARIPRSPREEALVGQVVVAGSLAAVVVEEAPGAAMVEQPAVVATGQCGAVVTEGG